MQEKMSWKNDVREPELERGCKGKRVGKMMPAKKSWKEDVRQKELEKRCKKNSVGKRM